MLLGRRSSVFFCGCREFTKRFIVLFSAFDLGVGMLFRSCSLCLGKFGLPRRNLSVSRCLEIIKGSGQPRSSSFKVSDFRCLLRSSGRKFSSCLLYRLAKVVICRLYALNRLPAFLRLRHCCHLKDCWNLTAELIICILQVLYIAIGHVVGDLRYHVLVKVVGQAIELGIGRKLRVHPIYDTFEQIKCLFKTPVF